MINPRWFELPLSRTNFNGPKGVRASEVRLYLQICKQSDTWKECRRKKPRVSRHVLYLCDERRDLKKKRYEAEGAEKYREANRRIQKAVKKAKEDLIGTQCEVIETCPRKKTKKKNNKKKKLRERTSWQTSISEKH